MFDSDEKRLASGPRTGPEPRLGLRAGREDVHILDRLSVVYRHRRAAATGFLLTVTVLMLQSYSTIPMYKAGARVLIEDERSTMVMGLDADNPIFWADPEP